MSVSPPATSRGFAELDEALTSGTGGVLVVTVRDEERDALLAHVARRLRAAGYAVVRATPTPTVALFAEVATQLGVEAAPARGTARVAASIAAAVVGGTRSRRAILGPLPAPGSWDDGVLRELGEHRCLAVMTTPGAPSSFGQRFDLTSALTARDKARFLAAIVESSGSLTRDLNALEAWWRHGGAPADAGAPPRAAHAFSVQQLSTGALGLLRMLAIAGRSLPTLALDDIDALARQELAGKGFIGTTDHAAVVEPHVDVQPVEEQVTQEIREKTADVLLRRDSPFATDPWALARAAELLLPYRPIDADAAMQRALRAAGDRRIAANLNARWRAAVSASSELDVTLALTGAARALDESDPLEALRWCEKAQQIAPNDARVSLAMARARVQLGDLVSARLLLESIRAAATDEELLAGTSVEQSEICYQTGEHALAIEHAKTVLASTSSPRTRLAARNVLGKILLARGDWDAADSHYAEDALTARAVGETTSELRARLNRGIAVLSKGMLDQAHQIFVDVRSDAESLGETRGAAFALSNLGIVAYRRRDYTAALEFWEATVKHADVLDSRHAIVNLAELRLRLGLVDNAEHAIRFGQRLSTHGNPPYRAAQFKLVAAQVALARGLTEVAHGEVQSAMAHARAAGVVDYEGTIAIVGARIALADGDLRGARAWLDVATEKVKATRSVAELALLRAMVLRASGEPALTAATDALALARGAGEDDLLIDVHALVAACARDELDLDTAEAHCGRAISIRDRVAAALPADVREAFLGKAEMLALADLKRSISPTSPPASERSRDRETAPESQPCRRVRVPELVGEAPRMRALMTAIEKAAASDATILVTGESGTGKEIVARALHAASPRANGPLVVVNCAALVDTLLVSELFGHEKGAFTGAAGRRRGRFEIADGGTLFLDEIGDISARTQVALLRVLQERTFERVGGTTTHRTDVRVVCATHRDLRAMVERGEFREDLYYRIRGITLEVPPLRARREDIPSLATHLLHRIGDEGGAKPMRLAADAVDLLLRHRWPGNVRELENVLRASSVFADGETITRADLLAASSDLAHVDETEHAGPHGGGPPAVPLTTAAYAHVREHRVSLHDMKREIERACITRALADANGSITRAAELLGMKRPRVSQLLKQYGLSAASTEES